MIKRTMILGGLVIVLNVLMAVPVSVSTTYAAEATAAATFVPDAIDQGIQSLISSRLYNGVYLEFKLDSRELVRRYYELGSKENNPNFVMGLKNAIYFVGSLETVKQNLANPPEKWKADMALTPCAKDAIAGAPNTALQAIPILAKAEELDALDIKIADSYIAKLDAQIAEQEKDIAMLKKLINAFEKVDGKL